MPGYQAFYRCEHLSVARCDILSDLTNIHHLNFCLQQRLLPPNSYSLWFIIMASEVTGPHAPTLDHMGHMHVMRYR